MIFKTTIATLTPFKFQHIDGSDSYQFTMEEFKRMAETAPGRPVTFDYDNTKRIGFIKSAEIVGDKLIAEIDIKLFCTPSVLSADSTLVDVAIVAKAAQTDLPPLKNEQYEILSVE